VILIELVLWKRRRSNIEVSIPPPSPVSFSPSVDNLVKLIEEPTNSIIQSTLKVQTYITLINLSLASLVHTNFDQQVNIED